MRDRFRAIHPTAPGRRGGAAALFAIAASGVLAACSSLLTGPLDLEGGRSTEATFSSESLIPGAGFARPAQSAAPAVAYGGITFQASVLPVDTALDAGTMGLRIQVRARNPSAETVRLPVRGCTVWPEFYDNPDGTGTPVWVPQGQCAQEPYDVMLAPGEEKVFDFLAYDVMLASGLEDGRYYIVARFHHADTTLRLHAGSADVRLRLPNMAYHVRVDDREGGLWARVRVENRNPGPVRLEFGACAVGLELYQNADLTGDPIRLGADRVCPAYLAVRTLGAGAVLDAPEFEYRLSDRATRGVPRGAYHLAVRLELNARTYRFPMGTVRVGG
ncbi:MAG: hypothetical protein KY467_04835 [Gemmatimonadetes bacterium]|nr:hypothetical protein [Gemmatimonadota bacterium]